MKGVERRGYEMIVRVADFMDARSADFPAESAGGLLLTALRDAIDIIEEKAAEQSSGLSIREEGTALRSVARRNLRNQMEAISRTAVALAISGTTTGLENRFQMPEGSSDQTLINAARAFAEDALPIKGRFTRFGLPADFLDNLNMAITEFEQAVNKQNLGKEMHVAATTAIDEALERAINIVRQLNAIVRNKYADNTPTLAVWESARHIQRSPQRATEPEQPPPAPPKP
ncbi:MAG TPA: hypothetical protein VF543_14685 [Pyrinomonadaceae bacterium]|jgi:hypothetical protein